MARGKVNETRKAKAVTGLTGMAEKSHKADKLAKTAKHKMFAGMLRAYNAGLTYDEIAEITKLSKIRVSQVLAEQRELAG